MSTYASDGSDYASTDSDFEDEDDDDDMYSNYRWDDKYDDTPPTELQPVGMSKNSGNRLFALIWDHEIVGENDKRDAHELHEDHESVIEDHVMFCRKRNLYNETFNTDSMVDILRSFPILSTDLQRMIGHAMILETTKMKYAYEMLEQEPVIKSFIGENGDVMEKVRLYRWRHIRDFTLRQDDGRFGTPAMIVAMDHAPEELVMEDKETLDLRQDVQEDTMEYLIRSERVIAAGPLHLPTELKDDPSSLPVGDLIMFNAKDTAEAIAFAEKLPAAQAGLYKDLRVHFYNALDITGKFVLEDPLRDAPGQQMKEAMEIWGYPVDDDQTPWLNW